MYVGDDLFLDGSNVQKIEKGVTVGGKVYWQDSILSDADKRKQKKNIRKPQVLETVA